MWRGKVEQISWQPRAFLYHNFLSDEECDYLMELARWARRAGSGGSLRTCASSHASMSVTAGSARAQQKQRCGNNLSLLFAAGASW